MSGNLVQVMGDVIFLVEVQVRICVIIWQVLFYFLVLFVMMVFLLCIVVYCMVFSLVRFFDLVMWIGLFVMFNVIVSFVIGFGIYVLVVVIIFMVVVIVILLIYCWKGWVWLDWMLLFWFIYCMFQGIIFLLNMVVMFNVGICFYDSLVSMIKIFLFWLKQCLEVVCYGVGLGQNLGVVFCSVGYDFFD